MRRRGPPQPVAIIAEDEDLGRLLLAESALAAGLDPKVFDNGVDALEAATVGEVALVLLDVDMPRLDGYTVCRRLRERGGFETVPIVMVTGHDDTAAINRAFDAGATDYISKPVNWALLPHRLAYILRNAASGRALADREAKVRTLVEAFPDALWVVSPSGELRWSPNDRAAGVTGSRAGHFERSMPPERLLEALAAIRHTAADGRPRQLEYREHRPHASHRSAELRFSRCEDGDVLVVRQDTTERTLAAEHIERLAYYDPLTELPNRQRCMEVADSLIVQAAEAGEGMAFVYLDLNAFKRVNDTFGHSVGDMVLKAVALRLLQTVEPFGLKAHVSLARLGGDEFVILVRDPEAQALALRVAGACCLALKQPVICNHLEFFTAPSVGISVYPDHGDDSGTLLKNADTAMHQAKSTGMAQIELYTAAMSARLRDWHDLESRLRRAVREDLLDLRFQPKFDLRDDSIAGVEALTRWYDDKHGEIPPNRFVDIAEESGLIVDLGIWLIRGVCRQLRAWLDRGIATPIAINLSGKDLVYGDPARVIETEMANFAIPPGMLEVEITESVFVNDLSAGRSSIEKLRQLGCRIALDDFGTGFSSLAYLTRFPPHRIKIDRSFVQNVDRSVSDAAIVNAIMSLAQSLDLTVTAEGVERRGQLEWLRARGCHEAQGYLLARPLAARALEEQFLCATPARAVPKASSRST